MSYVLTNKGRRAAELYVKEWEAKRKEILDAGKDTIDDWTRPLTVEDIEDDINFQGIDDEGEYINGWGVTDNYDMDYAIRLRVGKDFVEED
mgnify:CR=1 FL=1